jgi:hypothetical protein
MDARTRQTVLAIIADLGRLMEPEGRVATDDLVLLCAQLVRLCVWLAVARDEAPQAAHHGAVVPDTALQLCHHCGNVLGEL